MNASSEQSSWKLVPDSAGVVAFFDESRLAIAILSVELAPGWLTVLFDAISVKV